MLTKRCATLTATCVAVAATTFEALRGGEATFILMGALAILISVMALLTSWIVQEIRKTNRPADKAYELGYEMGYNKGWNEGVKSDVPKIGLARKAALG